MIEITVELNDRTEVQYIGEAIPRVGDHIFWDNKRFIVAQVQWHCTKPRNGNRTRARLQRVRIIVGGSMS